MKVTPTKMTPPSIYSRCMFHISMVLDLTWIMICTIPSILQAIYYTAVERPRKDVRGDIVMVTGSGLGLGRELSLRFARLGCQVICVDLVPECNAVTLELIREAGGKARGFACDVADRTAIMKLAEEVGRVDILVNNAGVYPFKGLSNASEGEIRTIIDVNLMSQLWTVQAFLPGMKERNYGHIVAISSIAALAGIAYMEPYATSKAAVTALMTSLDHELRNEKKQKVKLTTVHPYFINTRVEVEECANVRVPVMKLDATVDDIMRGILQETESFTVPRELIHFINLQRLLPKAFLDKCCELFPVSLSEPKGKDLFKQAMVDNFNKNTGSFITQTN